MTKALSVLLIDDNPARAEIVAAGLGAAGYRLLARLEGTQDLTTRVRELEPDVVVVSTDSPSRDSIEDMRRSTEQQPRPIAMFVDESDPATIAAAMEAGVSAYVVKGLAQDRVRSVVDVAVGHFNRYHAMREELERARLTLLERKTIDRAKGLLMEQKGLSEDAAYKLLRKLAMDQNKLACSPETLTYTPVALIASGTTDRERRIVGTLATIERLAQRADLQGPARCMVGDVVGLALGRDQEFRFESRMGL